MYTLTQKNLEQLLNEFKNNEFNFLDALEDYETLQNYISLCKDIEKTINKKNDISI